jgi:hypothetical protein
MLLLAGILLAALWEATRRAGDVWAQHSSRLASDGRAHAATTAEVWRARFDTAFSRWRSRSRLDAIDSDRGPALKALGDAVWRGDEVAQREARQRLVELEQERKRIEDELAAQLAGADERIRRARLPVQETIMVTPNEPNLAGSVGGKAADAQQEDRGPEGPSQPYPPPDEGNPPEPAQVPEPYPPPDEGTPPTPAPDPGQTESE